MSSPQVLSVYLAIIPGFMNWVLRP